MSGSSDDANANVAFKLSDAISLLSSQTAAMYQLWAFYTATVLGSLVFGFSRPQTGATAALFLIGYWAFALGELTLLIKTMKMIQEVSCYISSCYSSEQELYKGLGRLVSRIDKNTNPIWPSVAIQLLGNTCVSLLVMMNAAGWITLSK
jgi:hypothetical protein